VTDQVVFDTQEPAPQPPQPPAELPGAGMHAVPGAATRSAWGPSASWLELGPRTEHMFRQLSTNAGDSLRLTPTASAGKQGPCAVFGPGGARGARAQRGRTPEVVLLLLAAPAADARLY
jgi:hypothetical protein